MKKFIALLVFCSTMAFVKSDAQTLERKNLLEARSEMLGSLKSQKLLQDEMPVVSPSSAGRKSGGLAILYSLILPGMGELYAGNYGTGKYFTIAEAGLWGFYAGFNIYGNWQKDNYKTFAATHAHIEPSNMNDDLYADMGDFDDVEAYNDNQAVKGNYEEMYNPETQGWKWQNTAQRKEYRNMWVSSEKAFVNVRFAVAGMVLNRLISAINAARSAAKYNRGLEGSQDGVSVSVSGGTLGQAVQPGVMPSDLSLQIRTSF